MLGIFRQMIKIKDYHHPDDGIRTFKPNQPRETPILMPTSRGKYYCGSLRVQWRDPNNSQGKILKERHIEEVKESFILCESFIAEGD